jgi:protein-tyrosine-phosphatase
MQSNLRLTTRKRGDNVLPEVKSGGRVFAMTPHVVFVCVANRVRSVFAEFYLRDMFLKSGDDIIVSSGGFVPQALKNRLAEYNILSPDPFYDRPMAELTMAALLKKGIHVPEGWRSKELTIAMIEEADLIITALPAQKEDLSSLCQEISHRIFTIREMSRSDEGLFSEDFSVLTFNENFWHQVEEEPEYVSRMLREWEEILIETIPHIKKQLGIGNEEHKN